jgi:hypothetical protein
MGPVTLEYKPSTSSHDGIPLAISASVIEVGKAAFKIEIGME